MFSSERRRLVDLVARNRLPAVYTGREFVDAGGLSRGINLGTAKALGLPIPPAVLRRADQVIDP
jgi:hypothetical protein